MTTSTDPQHVATFAFAKKTIEDALAGDAEAMYLLRSKYGARLTYDKLYLKLDREFVRSQGEVDGRSVPIQLGIALAAESMCHTIAASKETDPDTAFVC